MREYKSFTTQLVWLPSGEYVRKECIQAIHLWPPDNYRSKYTVQVDTSSGYFTCSFNDIQSAQKEIARIAKLTNQKTS